MHDVNGNLAHLTAKEKIKVHQLWVDFLAQELRLKHFSVSSDGNCFYRSLSLLLYGTENEHQKTRSELVSWMRGRETLIDQHLGYDGVATAERIDKQAKDGVWAEDFVLAAASLYYQAPVVVLAYGDVPLQIYQCEYAVAKVEPLILSFENMSHYSPLVRTYSKAQIAQPDSIMKVHKLGGGSDFLLASKRKGKDTLIYVKKDQLQELMTAMTQ